MKLRRLRRTGITGASRSLAGARREASLAGSRPASTDRGCLGSVLIEQLAGVSSKRFLAVSRDVLALEVDLEQLERGLALEVASAGPFSGVVEQLALDRQQVERLFELAANLVLIELARGRARGFVRHP